MSKKNKEKSKVIFFRKKKLGFGFFSDFAKRTSNFPKTGKFIFLELQLSQVSAKKKTFLDHHSFIHHHSSDQTTGKSRQGLG